MTGGGAMWRLIAVRSLEALATLLAMSAIVFLLSRWSGDPVALLLGDGASEADRRALIQQLGLDRSIWSQYRVFLSGVLDGDFGRSLIGDRLPAFEIVRERLPQSIELAAVALLAALSLGIPLGVLAAVRQGSLIDGLVRGFALIGQSMPVFWLGAMLMFLFSVTLGWLPTSGYGTIRHMVMPTVTMALFSIAAIVRLSRTSMIEALGSDYVRFARIKGLSETEVVWKHALANSLIPVASFMGTFFATMITGAVVIETVFSWPGVGRLAYDSILRRDFPVVQAVVLMVTALYVACNLAVDLIYLWLDPRVRKGLV